MATVYWIHLPEHTDMFTQGYIGVTPDLKKRIKEHRFRLKEIKDRIIFTAIVLAEKSYCYFIEKKLRSARNIGWNKAPGGWRNNSMNGDENPNWEKFGEDASAFKGWYVTPKGRFPTSHLAATEFNLDAATIARKCKGRNVNGRFIPPQNGWAFEQKVRVTS